MPPDDPFAQIGWLNEPFQALPPNATDAQYAAAQAEYARRYAMLHPEEVPNQNPQQPPVNPPVQPPVQPPVNPPVQPPITPPQNPGGNSGPPTPPVTPPVNPPQNPRPPVQPPNPPVTPPGVSNPPVTPPVIPQVPGGLPRTPQTPASPLPGMLQSPPTTGFNPRLHIVQGITAGPVWSPEKTAAGVQAIRGQQQDQFHNVGQPLRPNVANIGLPSAARQAAFTQLSDNTRQGREIAGLGFQRQAAQANAQQQLSSERARAFAGGLPWLNLTISDMQSDLGDQLRRGSALAQLLSRMV